MAHGSASPGEAGFPAGLERTIVVDLTGKAARGHETHPPDDEPGDLLGPGADRPERRMPGRSQRKFRLRRRRCTSAVIRHRLKATSPGDLDYDYNRVSLSGPFQRERGNYTHMGDVTPLLTGIDDRFAIFGSGEEIRAEFDTGKLPALPAHWKRDYFFYANGYVKDMDWWDALAVYRGSTAVSRHEGLSRIRRGKNIRAMRAHSITS